MSVDVKDEEEIFSQQRKIYITSLSMMYPNRSKARVSIETQTQLTIN